MRKVFWIIPPCLAVVSFWVGGLRGQPSNKQEPAGIGKGKGSTEKNKPSTARSGKEASFEDFLAAYQRDWDEKLGQVQSRLSAMSPAELQALILQCVAKLKSHPDGDPGDKDERALLIKAVEQLGGLDHERALEWVMANVPEMKMQVMDGWADADPAGAFQKIISGTSMHPCSEATILKILQGFGDANPADLKTACQKVHWEVFANSDPFASSAFLLPPGASVQPWLESGAAVELKQEGVMLANFLSRWTSQNPDDALAHWLTGSELTAGDPAMTLATMLTLQPDEWAGRPAIKAALDRLAPEQRDRVADTLTTWVDAHSDPKWWEKDYPGLLKTPAAKEDQP